MRSDMFKVIVEKERRGSGEKFDNKSSRRYFRKLRPHSSLKEDYDDWEEEGRVNHLPKKQTGKKPQGYDSKSLNENLNPLKRFFMSRVGHKFDDVWAEVCDQINSNSTVQKHVLDHARDYVVQDCYYDAKGQVCHNDSYRGPQVISPTEYTKYGDKLYVEPETGIIRKVKIIHKKKEKPKPIVRIDIGHNQQLHKLNGVWFIVNLKEFPRYPLTTDFNGTGHHIINNYGSINDVILNKNLYWLSKNKMVLINTYGYYRNYEFSEKPTTMTAFMLGKDGLAYAACKRQASKKDLKKYGLK